MTPEIFATQGVLNGSLSDFNLSSIQKFGDVEFSYTGDVGLTDKNVRTVKGSIELKANNFLSFVKNIGFDYTPDIPVTTLTLSGNIEGSSKKFGLSDLSAYLGTNHIVGQFEYVPCSPRCGRADWRCFCERHRTPDALSTP